MYHNLLQTTSREKDIRDANKSHKSSYQKNLDCNPKLSKFYFNAKIYNL